MLSSADMPWLCSFRLWRLINHLLTYLLTCYQHSSTPYSDLLCGRPIGRIMHLAFPSVRMSVCPSVPYGLVTRKQKKRRKIIIGINVPQGTSKWSANFQLRMSKAKVIGQQKPQEIAAYLAYMFIYGRQIKRRRLRRRLQTRPNHC